MKAVEFGFNCGNRRVLCICADKEGAAVYIAGMLVGRTYTVSVKGKAHAYDLSTSTLSTIETIRDDIFAAFASGSAKLRDDYLGRLSF